MKKTLFLLILMALILPAAAQATLIFDDFSADPAMSLANAVDGYGNQVIVKRLPVPTTAGAGFLFESNIDINTFYHYAALRIGLDSSTSAESTYVRIAMGDDAVPRCYFGTRTSLAAFSPAASDPILLGTQTSVSYKLSLMYDPVRGAKCVLSANGAPLYDSGWIAVTGTLTADQIFIEVNDKDRKGWASITYDAPSSRIAFKSFAGDPEAPYIYKLEGFVNDVALRYIPAPPISTQLNAHITGDDSYKLYLSNDDSALGSLIGESDAGNWSTSETFAASLTPGVTNYIHIVGTDIGGYAGVLGDFSLGNTDFRFDNGTQTLLTNAINWKMSLTGFGTSYTLPSDCGANDGSKWDNVPGIPSAARWIWSNNGNDHNCTRYFSTPIRPVSIPTALTMDITACTQVFAYLSTDDSVLGTLFGEKTDNNWAWKSTLTVDLIPGVTNYLHLKTWTWGSTPSGLLGDFTLSDPSFHFANGTQLLTTDANNWKVSTVGWTDYERPLVRGLNDGTCPTFGPARPGPVPDILQSASWIETNYIYAEDRYYSTAISPTATGAIVGTINLCNFGGNRALAPVQVDVLIPGTSEVVRSQTFRLDNSGAYSINQLESGNYDIAFSACTWLQKVVNAHVSQDIPAEVNVNLMGGDVDGDNEITSTDLSILGLALGMAGD